MRVKVSLCILLVGLFGQQLRAQHVNASQSASAAGQTPVAKSYGKLPLSFEANAGQTDRSVRFLSRGNGYSLFLTDRAAVLTLTRHDTSNQAHAFRPDVPFTKAEWGWTPGQASTPEAAKSQSSGASASTPAPYLVSEEVPTTTAPRTDVIRMEIVASNADLHVEATDKLPGVANYFIGKDPAQWHTNLATYARVRYTSVYPGIDLVYYGNQGQLEYDFVIAPGADPGAAKLHFAGAEKLSLNAEGDLNIQAENGDVLFHKPVLYQLNNGKRESVAGSFQLLADNTIRFAVGAYDRTRALVIDPTLAYSTYLGGSGYHIPAGPDCCGDYGNAIAVDPEGNAYIAGQTGSTDFPTTKGAYQTTNVATGRNGNGNAFISKLNTTGTALVYSTYLGGTGSYFFDDAAQAIAVDAAGDAFVTGYTGSSDFPVTPDAYQKSNNTTGNGGYTAFVTKLDPTGIALIYSTYLGGSGLANCCGPAFGDSGNGIAVDNGGNAFIGGTTYSSDYPFTSGAYQKVNNAKAIGQDNLFVTKLNAQGSALVYSTYLGGSGYNEGCCYFFSGGDSAAGLAIDGQGSPYIAGSAYSQNFPVTSNAFQKINKADKSLNGTGAENINPVVTKLDPTFSTLIFSTYLGGTGNPYHGDQATSIAVDPSCYAYVTGFAGSSDFPVTAKALQTTDHALSNTLSSFVTKFNTTGSALEYSTYLSGDITDGHETGDVAHGIQVDAAGQAYVTGFAQSLDFPVSSNAYQPTNNEDVYTPADYYSGNAFIAQLNSAGSALVYGSYLGGSGSTDGAGGDSATAIALDAAGNAYVTGHTLSTDFPVLPNPGAFQTTMPAGAAGNQDSGNAFVAKFNIGSGAVVSPTTLAITPDANPAAADVKLTFSAYVEQNTACGFAATGTVSFVIDGGSPIKVTVDDTGHAAYSTTTLAVGKHTVAATYSGDMKYKPSSDQITETIVGAPTSVAAVSGSGQSAVYGASFAKPLTVIVKDAAGGVAPGVLVSFTGTGLAFTPGSVLTNESGEASVTALAAATGALKAVAAVSGISTEPSFVLSATKAVLTVTANNAKVPYGKPIPTLAYTTAGFVNGDKSGVVTGKAKETTTAKQDSPVGTYPIDIAQGTLTAANYSFKFEDGTLTITSLGQANDPTFSPKAGTYTSAQSVKLADSTSGSVIYYTIDGSTPTTKSTKYTKAIAVSKTETIKAIAVAPGYTQSGVASAVYKISP